jgi:hypothetical protein
MHMSILKSLKLAAATQSNSGNSEFAFREKLLRYLEEQKALVDAEVIGKPYAPTRRVSKTNDAGEAVRVEVPRRVRKGWFTDASGKMFFQLRYGSKPLEIAKGMNAVEVQDLAETSTVIRTIIDAVNAGELDAQLKSAIAERKAAFKPGVKKATA